MNAETRKLSIVLTKKQYEKIRKMAYETEKSLAEMIRELLRKVL